MIHSCNHKSPSSINAFFIINHFHILKSRTILFDERCMGRIFCNIIISISFRYELYYEAMRQTTLGLSATKTWNSKYKPELPLDCCQFRLMKRQCKACWSPDAHMLFEDSACHHKTELVSPGLSQSRHQYSPPSSPDQIKKPST